MKSLLFAAFAAVVLVGSASGSDTKPKEGPQVGAPLMFDVNGEYKTVALSNGPWKASSTGSLETAHIDGDRFYPAGTYLRAEHEGKSVVFRWEAKGLKGGAASWYAYAGEPKASAPKNTPFVLKASSAPVTLCSDSICAIGAPVVGNEVVTTGVVYTTYCDGQTCSQVPVTQYAGSAVYGSSYPTTTRTVQAAPVVQDCSTGQCNKNGQQNVILSFPYNFYTK